MAEDCPTQYTSMVCISPVHHNYYRLWCSIFSALWSDEEKRVMCWQLDPTEGPCRERRRLMQVPRNIEDKYVLDEGAQSAHEGNLVTITH